MGKWVVTWTYDFLNDTSKNIMYFFAFLNFINFYEICHSFPPLTEIQISHSIKMFTDFSF